jgi:ComF family protein
MPLSNFLGLEINNRLNARLSLEACFLCAAPAAGPSLCRDCLGALPRAKRPACPQCALPTSDGLLCGRCLKKPPAFDATFAVLDYGFPVDALIAAFKYGHRLQLAPLFADLFGERLRGAEAVDLLLPMPLAKLRLRERGFNQSAEIAKRLAARIEVELALAGGRRVRETESQVALPWDARARNVRGAFACDLDLAGLRVAIMDDVMTTGATMNEFAKTLRRQGAKRVVAWTLARAGEVDAIGRGDV